MASPSAIGSPGSLKVLLDPVVLLRTAYLAASLLILVIHAVPALRSRFLAYGSRATKPNRKDPPKHPPSPLEQLLDYVATFQVPHNYFTHFYIVSLACSLFSAWRMRIWDAAGLQQLVWTLMLLQGLRRMVESYTYTSTSKSKMWLAHWVLGLLFYLTINLAIFVEKPSGRRHKYALVPLVLLAHWRQHDYHHHLHTLRTQNKGYQLPSRTKFPVFCPHYTCEVAIYALLSLIAAPQGKAVNWTLACGTIFVATNLGVTAIGTKQWYIETFGADKVGPRKRMIPGIW